MSKGRILLVDDSPVARLSTAMMLRRLGDFELLEAEDGRQAVEMAAEHRPDVIVMDVVMPVMTGFEACVELRNRAQTRDIPIILATTRGEPEQIESGYEAGCNDYITKPVNGPELVAKVRSLLDLEVES